MSHKRNAILRRLCWGDWVVAAGLSLLVAVTAYAQIAPGRRGSMAMIHAPGMADRTISLQEDQSIEVQGKLGISRIEVKGGRVRMIDSACPIRLCLQIGWVDRPGQSVICLPNQVWLTIEGAPGEGPDAVTR
jgi:hypothetical protein